MSKKIPHWYEEMQDSFTEIAFTYCLSSKDLLPFFTAAVTRQLALSGLKEEFVKTTLDRMFENYKELKECMEKENGMDQRIR